MCQLKSLVATAMLACVSNAFASQVYSVTDLGVLQGGFRSEAYGINSAGQVVGQCQMSSGEYRAFVWDSVNGMQNVPGTANNYSEAWGINDQGHIVGNMVVNSYNHAFVYDGTTTTDFGFLCVARAINNSDKVAGYDGIAGPWNWDVGNGQQYIGQTGQYNGLSYGINNAGKICGESDTNINNVYTQDAFLYNGTMQDIGSLGGGSRGFGMNDNDWVVGRSFDGPNQGQGNTRAFYWNSGSGVQNMGTGANSDAFDINNLNVAVGDANFGAFRWQNNAFINLNTALDGSGAGWNLQSANSLNDSDWIVGTGTHNGQARGFLLRPVPEPASVVVLIAGLAAITRKRRPQGT